MNYFDSPFSASRYTAGRPSFHKLAIENISKFFRCVNGFENVLNVACGTGLSAEPLLQIARHVYATDSSGEMLAMTPQKEKIHYALAPAEKQPFSDGMFDLITVCSGIHLFNINDFLAEASRVLKENGFLVIYDNFFLGEIAGQPTFHDWYHNRYLQRFPTPPRKSNFSFSAPHLQPKHLYLIGEDEFTNAVNFTKSQLILYFTTQSNIISSVNYGRASYVETEEWLEAELETFFRNGEEQTFLFGNWMKFIEKHHY